MSETVIEQHTAQTVPERDAPEVVIVGFADTRRSFPTDISAEFWGLNALHRSDDLPEVEWSRWFQLHDLQDTHGRDPADLNDHLTFLRGLDCPVYLRPQDIGRYDIPNEQPFPIGTLLARFPGYFNNSVSYLLALAILMDFKRLHLFGVDMAQDAVLNSEYGHQRPSCEFFLGIAAGAGIEVNIPPGSDLLKASYLYGFEKPDAQTGKMTARLEELSHRKEQMKQRVGQLEAEKNQLVAGINQLDGAMQDCQYWLRNWTPNPVGPTPPVRQNGNGKVPS